MRTIWGVVLGVAILGAACGEGEAIECWQTPEGPREWDWAGYPCADDETLTCETGINCGPTLQCVDDEVRCEDGSRPFCKPSSECI
jgi:hypothetical protein